MNNGTKLRTLLRIAVSAYSAFCVWQTAIEALGEQLGIGWLAVFCTIAIIVCGWLVDFLTTYYNNDYTSAGEVGTDITRVLKEDPEAIAYVESPNDDDDDEDYDEDEEFDIEDGDEIIEENENGLE